VSKQLEDLQAELANYQADALAAAQYGAAEHAAISLANAQLIADKIERLIEQEGDK
jgi:hypothetical protein